MLDLKIDTPEWAYPLLKPVRYKGAKGGRGGGRSHFFAESLIESMVMNPDISIVCIREVQKSLKFSAKKLIEEKIKQLNASSHITILEKEIRSNFGGGVMIFEGMQDHTADSIKSLEGFKIAWVEEAQSLSKRSLDLLKPTIREEGSEIWFSWNPDKETDPVDLFFKENSHDMICVHHNIKDNPFAPQTLINEMENDRVRMSPEDFDHIWKGAYNTKSDALVFKGKYRVDYFEPEQDWTRLQGLDWGFSQDPTAGNVVYVADNKLYIRHEANKIELGLDETADYLIKEMPDFEKYVTRADNARPESISHVKKKGLPLIRGEAKLKIEDGISHMKSYDKIIIHPDCKETIKEFGLYSYKIDKRSGDILPEIVDKHNHHIDDIRYALKPMIKNKSNLVFVNM